MNLLIITQKVDQDDPVLGFFQRWIIEFAKKVDKVTVICLEEGSHKLPINVEVLSLGKEKKKSRFQYVFRFFKYILNYRRKYDLVFVHMNQEYVLLGAPIWSIFGKKVYLWRNHPRGSFITSLAVMVSDKVFCTSTFSFTAKFKKTEVMPAGIDTDFFSPEQGLKRIGRSILYLGRLSSIKKIHVLIDSLNILAKKNIEFHASIYGNSLNIPEEMEYFEKVKKNSEDLIKNRKLLMKKGVSNDEAKKLFNTHEILVNMTPSGSFDKVVIEMMSCGGIAIASNKSFEQIFPKVWRESLLFKEDDSYDLAEKLENLLSFSEEIRNKIGIESRASVIETQSLKNLVEKILK